MRRNRERGPWPLALALVAATTVLACSETPTNPDPDPDPPANQVPVAVAGAGGVVSIGLAVALDGSASTDADGDALTYAWSITSAPSGSTAALDGDDSATPSLTPDAAGDFVLQLIVNDGTDDSSPSSITITAEDNTASVMVIAAAGGTVVSVDGLVSLEIPAGALTEDTEISMTPMLAGQLPESVAGFEDDELVVYDMQPDGLQFTSPATMTFVEEGGLDEEGEEFEATIPVFVSVADGEATFLNEVVGTVEAGSEDVTWEAEVSHFSEISVFLAARLGALATVPDRVQQDTPFDVVVSVLSVDGRTGIDTVTIEDRSGPHIAPRSVPPIGDSFVESLLGYSSTHPYTCSVPGGFGATGRYAVRVGAELRPPPSSGLTGAIRELFDNPEARYSPKVDLEADVVCDPPPPPPPGSFADVALGGALEGVWPVEGPDGRTLYLVSSTGQIILLGEDGEQIEEITTSPAVVDDALFGAKGQVDESGAGVVVANGAEGVFVRSGTETELTLVRGGRTTDCWEQEPSPGTFLYACAGFENREIVFLTGSGSETPEVDDVLTDLFTPGGMSVFGADRPVSVWFGPDGFNENSPLLVATMTDDASDGGLVIVWLVDGEIVIEVAEDMNWPEPRQVRCSESGLCAMSVYGAPGRIGNLLNFNWDGTSVTRLGGAFMSVGKPVGIDVYQDGDRILVASADFEGRAVRVEEYVPGAGTFPTQTNSITYLLPGECMYPSSVVIRPRVPGLNQLIVACRGDGMSGGIVLVSVYEFPES